MTPGRRELLIIGGVAAAAAVAGGVAGAFYLQSKTGAATLLSSQFPDLTGRTRRIAEWQGSALLCNFWATWCAPCREELPLLDAAQQQNASRGLQVLGIGIDTVANIREYMKVVPVSFPMLVGEYAALALMRELGNRNGGLPFSVVMDQAGRVRERRLGAYTPAELTTVLGTLLR